MKMEEHPALKIERLRAEAVERYHRNKHLIDRAARAVYKKKWSALNPEKARGTKEQRQKKHQRFMFRYQNDPIFHAKICAKNRRTTPKRRMKQQDRLLRKKYGISLEDYNVMFARQGGRCAICRETGSDEKRQFLHVDHCHASKTVRGLLCQKCNRGLGLFKDSPESLLEAAAYISNGLTQKPREPNSLPSR